MKLQQHYLRVIYAFWAKIYDHYIDPRFSFDRQKAVNSLAIAKEEKILEIGVGTGLNLPYYPRGCSVTGIDFSSSMLEKAKRKKSKAAVELEIADATALPFQDNSFDKAIATYVVRVSPLPQKIFAEAARVVRNEGLFCVVDRFKGNAQHTNFLSKVKLFLQGGGKDYSPEELTANTSWRIISSEDIGAWKNTKLVVLKNYKESVDTQPQ